MAYLQLRNLRKSYGFAGKSVEVLGGVEFDVAEGEFVAMLGPPSCGKSTLVMLVAGLSLPDYGSISLAGLPVVAPGPDRYVLSHHYSPPPWQSLVENIAQAASGATPGRPADEYRRTAERHLSAVGLTDANAKKSRELTRDMRRRLSLARALAAGPDLLIVDEPGAGLNGTARARLLHDIVKLTTTQRQTVLLATDDVDAALAAADRIVLLSPGPRTTVIREFVIPGTKPREARTIRHDALLQQMRREIIAAMQESAGRAASSIEQATTDDTPAEADELPTGPQRLRETSERTILIG